MPHEYIVYQDEAGEWRWNKHHVENPSEVTADSGEGYTTQYDAIRAAEADRETVDIITVRDQETDDGPEDEAA